MRGEIEKERKKKRDFTLILGSSQQRYIKEHL